MLTLGPKSTHTLKILAEENFSFPIHIQNYQRDILYVMCIIQNQYCMNVVYITQNKGWYKLHSPKWIYIYKSHYTVASLADAGAEKTKWETFVSRYVLVYMLVLRKWEQKSPAKTNPRIECNNRRTLKCFLLKYVNSISYLLFYWVFRQTSWRSHHHCRRRCRNKNRCANMYYNIRLRT